MSTERDIRGMTEEVEMSSSSLSVYETNNLSQIRRRLDLRADFEKGKNCDSNEHLKESQALVKSRGIHFDVRLIAWGKEARCTEMLLRERA